MHDIVIDDIQENKRLMEKLIKNERIMPYEVVNVYRLEDKDNPFHLFVDYIDDYFDEEKMPLVKLNYGDVSNHDYFEKLYERHKLSLIHI